MNDESLLVCTSCSSDLGAVGTRMVRGCDRDQVDSRPVIIPKLGEVFAGRYEIIAPLGSGGAGTVFRARDRILGEQLALKLVRPGRGHSDSHLEQFVHETSTARRITHQNVVRVYDLGLCGDTVFLSMELVEGGTLAEWIRRHGARAPLTRTLAIADGLCRGLHAAHRAGVIHSDIKPANALIAQDDRPILADFGIARLRGEGLPDGQVYGTPAYMSPEHFLGEELTVSSDIYSLGVLLYELFTGRRPFTGSFEELSELHAREMPTRPSELNPRLPKAVDAIVLRAMAKEPEERFDSVEALRDALETATGVPRLSRAARLTNLPPTRSGRRRAALIAASLLAMAGVGLFGWNLMRDEAGTRVDAAAHASTPKVWPESTLENYRLGMNFMESFEFPEANAKFSAALAESPEHSKSLVARAYVLLWQMKPEEALADIEKAEALSEGLSEQDRAMLPLLRAKASHDYEESNRIAVGLRKRFPENRRFAFEVADYDYHTGHYARAFSVLDGLARENTNNAIVWGHAAWAAYEIGDDSQTNAFFKGWREALPHPDAYVSSADAALAQGDASAAQSLIEAMQWRYPDAKTNLPAAIITLWSTLQREGRSAAEALLPTVRPLDQLGYWTSYGQTRRATEILRHDKTPMAQSAMALAHAVGGSPASTVLASLPMGVRYDVQQGINAIAAALLASSPATARKLILTSPQLQHEVYEELIQAYELWQADRPVEAAKRLQKARSRFHSLREHHVFYFYLAGRLALANDDPQGAIAELEHVLRTRRTVGQFAQLHSLSLYWSARAYESMGDRDSALASYERLAKIWSKADPSQTEATDVRKRLKALRRSQRL